jgi:hypothetical protein
MPLNSTTDNLPAETATLQDERSVYEMWNPCQETLDYWDLQEEVIERRIVLQLKYDSNHAATVSTLRALHQTLISGPHGKDPLESYADGFEDGSCFYFGSHLDEYARPFDPIHETAAFITRRHLGQDVDENTKMDEEFKWTEAAIRFVPALYDFVTRLIRLFIAQNPDMLANAPERWRLQMMEWKTASVIAQMLPKWITSST